IGLLKPLAISVMLMLALGLSGRNLPELYRLMKAGIRGATINCEAQSVTLLFCLLFTLLLLRTLTPPCTADELIYHLPVPKEFVKRGSNFPAYDNLFGNLPFLVHMIYTLFLMADSDISAKVFSLFLAIATAFALYGFCRRFLTQRTGVLAVFAFFSAGMVVEVSVTARI